MTKSSPAKRLSSPDFENSERLRRRRASREPDLESTPQPQLQQRPIYRNQSTQTAEIVAEDIAEPYKSTRRQKTPREKVDKVVGYLRETYRWTVPTFVENYVTAKRSFGSNSETHEKHAEKLSAAIFNNPVIEEALLPVENTKLSKLQYKPLQKKIKEELELLIQDKVRNEGKENERANPRRLRLFNATEPVEDIKLNLIVATVQKEAPTLWSFLTSLIRQRPYRSPREDQDLQSYNGSLFMICAILTNTRAPQGSTLFQSLIAVHLYNIGLKRRGIELLNRLGVTVSYSQLSKIRKDLAEVREVSNSSEETIPGKILSNSSVLF